MTRILKKRGVRIPDDIAIVSKDFALKNEFFEPELTSISHPIYKKAEAAVKILMEVVEGQRNVENLYSVTLQPELVQGASTSQILSQVS